MKKICSVLLIGILFLTVLCTLSSCKMPGCPEDAEIRQAVEKLLPTAYDAAYCIFGPGLTPNPDYKIDESWTTAHYIPVSREEKCKTKSDFEAMLRAAFSEKYAAELLSIAFSNGGVSMSRYSEQDGRLTIDVTQKPVYELKTEYYTDTLKVTSGTKTACVVEISYSIDGGITKATGELQLVRENEKWVFDNSPY